ncbi:hypothetical protein M011DRAFT_494192 [Sporormia fimetaria CBS 119925]|uniref:Nucleoside diphosphatase n=1 Tax=Sporormia fimetaria CBS 119925 TaxID=1340428 RepID=A0A6A6VF86_9PLEO|nr:hypothetical protein M011DRAFT_494192 [Sporormia fimetaria CBS 119925]
MDEKDPSRPGISTFGDSPHSVGPDHLHELLSHALKHVPPEDVPHTPLFLLATAGMRILDEPKQKAVLAEVCDFARKNTKFQLPDCGLHVQVIPGETEGLYGWIAANYLLGGFDKPADHAHGKDHYTYGFLDMGGASSQIAFAPNATEAAKHAEDLTLLRLRTVGGTPLEYKVFVTTWLGFGVNQARERYVKALLESNPDARELPDPCLPLGLKVDQHGERIGSGSKSKHAGPLLVGTGEFTECLHRTYPLLEKEKACLDQPCLINGQHTPAIDFDVNHFVGVSEYWHSTHEIFEMAHTDRVYDFKTYQNRVLEFCSQDWDDIEKLLAKKKWGKKVDETTAQEICFKASWLINMLHDGIGVPRVGLEEHKGSDSSNSTKALLGSAKKKGFLDPFQPVNKIHGTEVSWTLGKMVLYASSEVQPVSTGALPVGFGPNMPGGKASDFQYPGGTYLPLVDGSDKDRWHDRLFSENSRRIPGFVILVLIVCVVGFLLCGQERRRNLARKVSRLIGRKSGKHSASRRRGGLASKFFGSTPAYERVLEDGQADELELGSLDNFPDQEYSDSSEEGHMGLASGRATPQVKAGLPEPSYFDHRPDVVAQGAGLGLGPPSAGFTNAMTRGGLMSRTDSRERLAGGRRSRLNSPSRLRALRENAD